MNEQTKKDQNYIARMLKLLKGSNLTIAHNILAAQFRVTQYEERTRAAEIVELLQVRIADQEPYIQLDTSTRMVVQSELDGIRDSILCPPTL